MCNDVIDALLGTSFPIVVVKAVNRRFEALVGQTAAVEFELGRPMLADVSAGLEGGGV